MMDETNAARFEDAIRAQYVTDTRWPKGGCGCVSRNYPDGKWRIVCDPRPEAEQPTFRTRDEAAAAERALIKTMESAGT